MLHHWHALYHPELFSLERLTGADRADRLNIIFHFKVMLKLSGPDVSEMGRTWQLSAGVTRWQRCVRNRHWCCDVATNAQHHIIKDLKHTTDHTHLIQHMHTHTEGLMAWSQGKKHLWRFVVNKNHFVFVCSSVSPAATCNKESTSGRTPGPAEEVGYRPATNCTSCLRGSGHSYLRHALKL